MRLPVYLGAFPLLLCSSYWEKKISLFKGVSLLPPQMIDKIFISVPHRPLVAVSGSQPSFPHKPFIKQTF